MGKSNKFSLTTKSHSSTRVNPYDKITLNALNISCPDKQIALPKLEGNGKQLIFIELYSLFIFIIALGVQYLNLYRSMWWLLPKVRSHHLIIHSDVSQFSLIFIGQSSIIAIIRALMHKTNIIPETLTTIVTATASWICSYYLFKCAYRIWSNFGLNGLSFVSYPIVLSLILHSTHIIQVFEGCCKLGKPDLSFLTLSMTLFSTHIEFNDEKLCHTCSNQPDEIRDEVERFKAIFNDRLKFVLYKSLLLAYYSAFVPLCFAQSYLYHDHTWTAQHCVITWISALIMLISSSYTPHFYDVLHRSAYHFGKWQKLEARNTLVPCINWSENVIYPQGVVVKHYRGYFRSESVSNCAQPGVSSQLRYYNLFSNPKIGYAGTLALLGLLMTAQMYLLLISTEWYRLIAMISMMLINVCSIYRLVKASVVMTKIYKTKKH